MAQYDIHFDEKLQKTREEIKSRYDDIDKDTLTEVIRMTLLTSIAIDEHNGYKRVRYAPYPNWCCQKCGEHIGYLGRFMEWSRLADLLMNRHKCG